MGVTLTRCGDGYCVKGRESVQVRKHSSRTWSGRLGCYEATSWYAYDTSAVEEQANDWDCIRLADGTLQKPFKRVGRKHTSLAALRKELERLLG